MMSASRDVSRFGGPREAHSVSNSRSRTASGMRRVAVSSPQGMEPNAILNTGQELDYGPDGSRGESYVRAHTHGRLDSRRSDHVQEPL